MPRRRRIIQPGYPYHVILRGNGGQSIFREEGDLVRFCLLMQYASERHDILIHGFCLMGNHVHLLLEPTTIGLSQGVHAFAFRYAQYFNRKYSCEGHLFQGRYKGMIVQNGIYLRRLIRYIHRNPVRAQMVMHPKDYKWSSYLAYLNLDEYTWLSKDRIFAMFEPDEVNRKADFDTVFETAFEAYMTADDADANDHIDAIRRSLTFGAYGDLNFLRKFCGDEVDELGLAVRLGDSDGEAELLKLIRIVSEQFKISEEIIRGPSREAEVVRARAVLSLLVMRNKIASLSDLAELLSRDHSSLSRLRRKAEEDSTLMQASNEINDLLMALHTTGR